MHLLLLYTPPIHPLHPFYHTYRSRQILDDFREAYYWLAQNSASDARVMSWWDYGYQIAGMANRTTLVDNNTWNNSHIALVGKAMSSNETAAYEIMTALDVDYVLVIFGGVIGYSGDDINKFLWMVRIAEGEHPKDIKVGLDGVGRLVLSWVFCFLFRCSCKWKSKSLLFVLEASSLSGIY